MNVFYEYPYWYQCPLCGDAAVYFKRKPKGGDLFASKDASHINGREIKSGDPFECDSCHKSLIYHHPMVENIYERL